MNPYPGLRPFGEEDQDCFFGRDEEIDELVERLANRRLIAVHGTSGCGKSSLVRAGVIPLLRSGLADPSMGAWRILTLKPGAKPLEALDRACGVQLPQRTHALRDWARSNTQDVRTLVLVDQFEEIFAFRNSNLKNDGGSAASLFVDMILTATSDRESGLYSLLTMRSDYLGECAVFRNLPEALNDGSYLVPQLTRLKQQDAIERPAEACGVSFQPALVQRLLNDASDDPDKLPVLQHLLKRLWEVHRGNSVDLLRREGQKDEEGDYFQVGGWNGALEQDADAVLAGFPNEQDEVRRLFQWITELGPGRRPARRPCDLSELAGFVGLPLERLNKIVTAFANHDFLRREPHGSEERLDLMHESVMWQWPRLERWIAEEDREASRLRFYNEARNRRLLIGGASLEDVGALREKIEASRQWARRYLTEPDEVEGVLGWIADIYREKRRETEALNVIEHSRSLRDAGRELESLHFAVRAIDLMPPIRSAVLLDLCAIHPEVTLLSTFGDSVRGVAWSADKELVASWADDSLVRLWKAQTGDPFGTPLHHDGRVLGACFSGLDHHPMRLLTWSDDRTARLWHMTNGRQVVFEGHRLPVRGAQFSGDEGRVLTWSDDRTALIWDSRTSLALIRFEHEGAVLGAEFIRNESQVLTWSLDGTARIWDAKTGALVCDLPHQSLKGASYASFKKLLSHDRVVTWSSDQSVRLWNAQDGKPIGDPLLSRFQVQGALVSPKGNRLLTWSGTPQLQLGGLRVTRAGPNSPTSRGEATVWRVDGLLEHTLSHEAAVTGARFNNDGSRILTHSADGSARLWDAETGTPIDPPLLHAGAVVGAEFDTGESRILTWSSDHTAQLWNARNGSRIGLSMQHDGAVLGARLSDQSRILTWSEAGVRLWEMQERAPSNATFRHYRAVRGARLNADESRILTWSHDGTACLWNAATRELITSLGHHKQSVGGARFSPDETRILTWCGNRALLWDAHADQPMGTTLQHEAAVSGARFSSDGGRILTWSEDTTAKLWDAWTGHHLSPTLEHGDAVLGARFSPDGSRILTWSRDNTTRIWNSKSGQETGVPLRHLDRVNGAQFSANGRRIVTCSSDHTARIWDAVTRDGFAVEYQVSVRVEHQGSVRGAEPSHDSSRLLTWSSDNTARLWDARTGEPISPSLSHDKPVLGARFVKGEELVLTWSEDGTARIWEARTGLQLGPSIERPGISDARFCHMGGSILTVSDDAVRIRTLNADLDFPFEHLRLWLQAVTGTEYDFTARQLKTLTAANWREVWIRYQQVAVEHAKTCQYLEANHWLRFISN